MANARSSSPTMIGNDRSLGVAGEEAEARQPGLQKMRIPPELLPALRLALDDVDGGPGRRGGRRGQGGGEDQASRGVPDVIDDRALAGDEAPDRGQRLGERPHDQVDFVLHAEVLGGAPAARPQHAQAVRVVDHEGGPEIAGDLHDLRQGRDVALHGEHAVHHHQPPAGAPIGGHEAPQLGRIVVGKLADLRKGEAGAVDDAGVVLLVEIDGVTAIEQAGDGAQVHLEPGGEGHRRRLADEPRQLLLERLVQA